VYLCLNNVTLLQSIQLLKNV